MGANAWAGVVTLYSQNFESFATDADFTTVPGYWQSAGANVQKIADNSGNKYLTYQTGTGSTRNAAVNFNISSFSAGDNWTVSFDASLTPGTKDSGMFLAIVGAKGTATAGNSWSQSTGNLFSVANTASSPTSYTVTLGGAALAEPLTLTSGSYYHYELNWDGTNLNLTITKDGEVSPALSTSKAYSSSDNTTYGNPKAIFWVTTRYYGTTNIDDILVTEEVAGDVANDPTITLTGVDGTSRTYLITYTEGETLHYTLPGGSEQTVSTGSSYVVTATASGTLSAYTTNGTATSNTVNEAVDATAITLNAPTYFITAMTESGTRYYPTYNATSNQSDKTLSPTATISATFNGSDVVLPYEVTEAGTLTITASASGYTSSSTDIEFATAPSYVLANSADFTEINSSNIATKLDGTWTIGDGSTRWASWSKTGGVNAAGESTGDDKYYVASTTGEFPLSIYSDFVEMSTSGTNLIIGWGFGRNNATAAFSLPGADSKGIAQYIESDYGNAEYSRFVTGVTDLACTTYTAGVIKGVKYYTPLVASITTAAIPASTYGTIASAYALDCANLPAGLEAYKVSEITASAVKLEKVTEAVAAGTGLILKGTASTAYEIPVVATGSDISSTNKLQAAVSAYDCDANEVYILQTGEFHKVTAASTVPAGKAYLLASNVPSGAGARALAFSFGDETTGINVVNGAGVMVNGEVYNLQGQRVDAPTKGLYIVNGKKVIVK